MRIQGIVILLAALGAAEAQASSIETAQPLSGAGPSIITLGDKAAVDPSIVAAVSETGPSPSIIVVPDTPATPSIVTLNVPGPADEAAAPSSQGVAPTVIRGGEVGSTSPRPSAAPSEAAAAPAGEPLLDLNDKGTPAKRKALKRQAERLAEQAAEAAKNPQPDPSVQPAPSGQ